MNIQRVVLMGGCCLAFGAAFLNTGLLLMTGTSVSHLTGDLSRLSLDLVQEKAEVLVELSKVSTALFSFLGGAFFAGVLIHQTTVDFARPYGRVVTGIGVLFLLSEYLLDRSPVAAIALAAFGCGIQNALAARYRGIVLRTTHITGLITDLGATLGMKARGIDVPRPNWLVPTLLIVSFFMGALAAAGVALILAQNPVLIAGFGYTAAGIVWTIAKHGFHRLVPPGSGE